MNPRPPRRQSAQGRRTSDAKIGRGRLETGGTQWQSEKTRRPYAFAVARFLEWCEGHGLPLEKIEPVLVAAYIEDCRGSSPSRRLGLVA